MTAKKLPPDISSPEGKGSAAHLSIAEIEHLAAFAKAQGIQLPADQNQERQLPCLTTSTLVRKVLLLEQFINDLFADLRNIRANLESRIEEASLRSHEQAMVMLCASKSQVRRWRESGELKATWLDSHPRYQPQHIKAFIDSRTKQGRPIKKSNTAHPAKNAVCAQSKKNRPATKKAKTKKKELS